MIIGSAGSCRDWRGLGQRPGSERPGHSPAQPPPAIRPLAASNRSRSAGKRALRESTAGSSEYPLPRLGRAPVVVAQPVEDGEVPQRDEGALMILVEGAAEGLDRLGRGGGGGVQIAAAVEDDGEVAGRHRDAEVPVAQEAAPHLE